MAEQFGVINHSWGGISPVFAVWELPAKKWHFVSVPNNATGSNADSKFGLILQDVTVTGVWTLTLKPWHHIEFLVRFTKMIQCVDLWEVPESSCFGSFCWLIVVLLLFFFFFIGANINSKGRCCGGLITKTNLMKDAENSIFNILLFNFAFIFLCASQKKQSAFHFFHRMSVRIVALQAPRASIHASIYLCDGWGIVKDKQHAITWG